MNETGVAHAYRESTAQGASAVGRVVALFDTILRDFQRALLAIDAGDVQTRVSELNHALTIIGELQGVLDYQRGGEAAVRFERFYNVTRGLILSANVGVSRESLLELMELYKPVRQAWSQVDQKLTNVETIESRKVSSATPPNSSPRAANHTPAEEAQPAGKWSA
jgi:flagellar protein FliS